MARFFKHRHKPGPSKNEVKVQRAQDAARRARSAGRLQDRFPEVEHLRVLLELLSPQGSPLGREVREYGPEDVVDFAVPCPGRCGSTGSFDLATKIGAVITALETSSESSGVCQEPLYAGSPDPCGTKLVCRVEASYAPRPVE